MTYSKVFVSRLKHVIATDTGLLVSNYLDQVEIPYSDITSVHENKLSSARPITLHLKHPCIFGTKIIFMPYTYDRLFHLWRDHPVTELIRARMEGRVVTTGPDSATLEDPPGHQQTAQEPSEPEPMRCDSCDDILTSPRCN